MPNFDPFDAPTDIVLMRGVPTPGIAEVYDVISEHEWREGRSYGHAGATLRYLGKKLARFKIKITLLTPEHMEEWESFLRVLAPPSPDSPGWSETQQASLSFLETTPQPTANAELSRLARVNALRAQRAAASARPRGTVIDLGHPLLEQHGIASGGVLRIDGPRDANAGEWVVEIAMIEFRRPVYVASTPAGSGNRPPEADPYDRLIDQNTERINEMVRELAAR